MGDGDVIEYLCFTDLVTLSLSFLPYISIGLIHHGPDRESVTSEMSTVVASMLKSVTMFFSAPED